MMKHTQTIFAKFCGRAYSTIASSPVSSSVKHAWKEQDGFVLSLVFLDIYKRREHWYKVDKMYEEHAKRTMELYERSERYRNIMTRFLLEELKSRP